MKVFNSPNIDFLKKKKKGQGFIVIESDPGDFNKGISEMKYHGIILNVI